MGNEQGLLISIEIKVQGWIHVMIAIMLKLYIHAGKTKRRHGENDLLGSKIWDE